MDRSIDPLSTGELARLWKPEHLYGISLFKACFNKFFYKKHKHQEFAIGVIEKGAQKFYHKGNQYVAAPRTIITVNPDEIHDGMPATQNGYQYRMVYISQEIMNDIITGHSERKKHTGYFKRPVTMDTKVAVKLDHALRLLDGDQKNSLEYHTYLIQVILDLFQRYSAPNPRVDRRLKDRRVVSEALEYIRSRVSENITLEEIAQSVGLSQYHFLRIFKNTTGLPPHAYLVQMRVELAKTAIEKGCSIASAALQSGFSDQSHLTRCFRSVYGLPPGRYQKALFR